MYNRYIHNDNGGYVRVPQEEKSPAHAAPEASKDVPLKQPPPPSGQSHAHKPSPEPPRHADSLTGILRHLLDQFHLDHVDSGDLLSSGLSTLMDEEMEALLHAVTPYIPNTRLRGVS